MPMHPHRALAFRLQAAVLLRAVLDEQLLPKTAINCWPYEGNEDLSVLCAYTMLWFFESDEERHQQEAYYTDLQLNEMRVAALHLEQGEEIPSELIESYRGIMVRGTPAYGFRWVWMLPWWQSKMTWHGWVSMIDRVIQPLKHGFKRS